MKPVEPNLGPTDFAAKFPFEGEYIMCVGGYRQDPRSNYLYRAEPERHTFLRIEQERKCSFVLPIGIGLTRQFILV